MADILQSYDTRPFPKEERRRTALPAVVEAGVKQELSFLNSVYDNMNAGVLTVEQAKEIMWMIENVETLLAEAADILSTEEAEVYTEILENCVVDDLPIAGVGALSKQIIYESGRPDSIYKPIDWTRTFMEGTDHVALSMNRRMNYLENELHSYFESYGERGFEDDMSMTYLESSDPSDLSLKSYLQVVTEAAAITDRISAEDGVSILSFIEAALMDEFTVAAMAPIAVPGGEKTEEEVVLTKNPEKKKPAVIPEYARMTEAVANAMLHEYGWYTLEAAVVYKNNIVFDSVARKLFNTMGEMIKLKNPQDANESFKSALNLRKNQYKFSFVDSNDPKVNDTIRARILSNGFKPVKDNGKVARYQMDKKPIMITVEFEDIHTGLDIEYTSEAVTESTMIDDGAMRAPIISLENDNKLKDRLIAFCESTPGDYMRESVQMLEETSAYTKIQQLKNNWGESEGVTEACDILLAALESGPDLDTNESVDAAMEKIKQLMIVETACEAVLDAVEFKYDFAFTEDASKEDIDPDIKSTIELLNRLGYKTKYSSAGHREERSKDDRDRDGVYYGKLYTTARITFDGNYKFDKLPKGWYQNFNSDKTGIYVKPFTYNEKDGSPDEAFAKWRSEYIAALKDWAENLKEAKDTKAETATEESTESFFG